MSSVVADRFAANGSSWIDLATGDLVRLRMLSAASRGAQLAWCTSCDALARLRHPLVCPLLDYGILDGGARFEAYAVRPALAVSAAADRRLRAHALAFLAAHAAAASAGDLEFLLRATSAGPARGGSPIGIVLQDRPAASLLADFLDAATPRGPGLLTICGERGSGLRTFRDAAARAARIRGYAPVAAAMLGLTWLSDRLVERHVCLFIDDSASLADRRAVGLLLARLGRESTRRHVVLTFTRTAGDPWNTLHLSSMGVTAMTAMVYPGTAASAAKLFEAARASGGLPGRFIERLGASAYEDHVSRTSVAHEAAHPYVASAEPAPTPTRRGTSTLDRALARADMLARRGRHAAAARLLPRAMRVLSARGDTVTAAQCGERLGRLHLERGNVAAAAQAFERAQALAGDTPIGRQANLGLALTWIEGARFAEAEALLRSLAGSEAVAEAGLASRIAYGLARCLVWQRRVHEAIATLEPFASDEAGDVWCVALAAEARAAVGETARAVTLARRALQMADGVDDQAAVAASFRALCVALTAAGDTLAAADAGNRARETAERAHLPIVALEIRASLLDALARAAPTAAKTRRLATTLDRLVNRRGVPRLAQLQIRDVLARLTGRAAQAPSTSMTDLEQLLEISQTSADDTKALDRICATIGEKLRAAAVVIVTASAHQPVGRHGRSWGADGPAVERVLMSGRGVAPGVSGAGLEGAEPVRYGGEVVAVVACRWVPGTVVDVDRCVIVLKAAALAAAAPVRGILDRTTPRPPDAAWNDLLGDSGAAIALREAAARAARAPFPVLIEGESGSGKELVARAIHRLSSRRDRRFCAVNCAALTDELLEAELFGHARGAFTGAIRERPGLFEEADGGTLFLDEVAELSPRGQAKLLRVLQEGEIRRIGENFPRRVDARIVCATNRRLEPEVAAGRFRADLRFRLDVIRVSVPPLRDRLSDVPALAAHFWEQSAARVGSRATLAPETLAALARYDWPGNVRELQNVIAWMAVQSPWRGRIGIGALPASVAAAIGTPAMSFEAARVEFERRFVRTALVRSNGHRGRAARSIGVSRQALAKMIKRLKIDERPFA